MTDLFFLNALILCFFSIVLIEEQFFPTKDVLQKFRKKIPTPTILIFSLACVCFAVLLLIRQQTFIWKYVFFSFGILVLAHGVWLSLGKGYKTFLTSVGIGVLLILYRFFFPSTTSHTLLLFFALSWLGSFLVTTDLFNPKRFLIISIALFLYSTVYTWLQVHTTIIHTLTTTQGFPLFLAVGSSSIGTADLVWVVTFLSLLKKQKQKIGAVGIFIVSNIILGLVAFIIPSFIGISLLLLWIPLGLFYLYFVRQNQR